MGLEQHEHECRLIPAFTGRMQNLEVLKGIDTISGFSAFFTKGINFCYFFFFPGPKILKYFTFLGQHRIYPANKILMSEFVGILMFISSLIFMLY